MASRDMMRLEAPAAQAELEVLKALKVGDTRASPLFPALGTSVEWTATAVSDKQWDFDGRFLGQPLFKAVIAVNAEMLTLDIKEG